MLKTVVSIIAKNPPSIAIAFAGVLAIAGNSLAYLFLIAGVFMQAVWMLKSRKH